MFSAGQTKLICKWQPVIRNFLLGRDSIVESQNGKSLNFPAYCRPAEIFLDLGRARCNLKGGRSVPVSLRISLLSSATSGIAFTLRASGIRIATIIHRPEGI
jgi:hypothetical protein